MSDFGCTSFHGPLIAIFFSCGAQLSSVTARKSLEALYAEDLPDDQRNGISLDPVGLEDVVVAGHEPIVV